MPDELAPHLRRFEDHARRVVEQNGPGHHGADNYVAAICEVIHTFVQHDTEWCAVATDELARRLTSDPGSLRRDDLRGQLATLAESFRKRGRGTDQ